MNAIAAKCAAVWIILLSALVIQPPPPAQAEDSHVKGTVASAPIEGPRVPIGKPSVLASGQRRIPSRHAGPEFRSWPVSGNTCWLNKAVPGKGERNAFGRHRNFE